VPRLAAVAQGGTAFYCVRNSANDQPSTVDAGDTKWLWEGLLGQSATTPYFRVATKDVSPGVHAVKLTSVDSRGVRRTYRGRLKVLPPRPLHQRKQAHLIERIVLERTQVHSGEYFTVRVRTHPQGSPSRVHVYIHGRWANPRVLHIKGRAGMRQLHVTAVTADAFDVGSVDIEVVAGTPLRHPPDSYVAPHPTLPLTAIFRIGRDPDTPQTYRWNFRDGQTATTTTGDVSHDYTDFVDADAPYAVAQVPLRVLGPMSPAARRIRSGIQPSPA
jgi:hypothetical protein